MGPESQAAGPRSPPRTEGLLFLALGSWSCPSLSESLKRESGCGLQGQGGPSVPAAQCVLGKPLLSVAQFPVCPRGMTFLPGLPLRMDCRLCVSLFAWGQSQAQPSQMQVCWDLMAAERWPRAPVLTHASSQGTTSLSFPICAMGHYAHLPEHWWGGLSRQEVLDQGGLARVCCVRVCASARVCIHTDAHTESRCYDKHPQ